MKAQEFDAAVRWFDNLADEPAKRKALDRRRHRISHVEVSEMRT